MGFSKGNKFGKGRPRGRKSTHMPELRDSLRSYLGECITRLIEDEVQGRKNYHRLQVAQFISQLVFVNERDLMQADANANDLPVKFNVTMNMDGTTKEYSDGTVERLN